MSSILVVDDNEDLCLMLSRLLRKLGHETACAGDGDAALNALRQRAFDLVILDIMMPEMDGLEVLSRIKSDPTTAQTPVVMCSAVQEPEAEQLARRRGAADFWLKATFDFQQLGERVSQHLTPHSASRAGG
jgi:CheY-like chemotaxis protein